MDYRGATVLSRLTYRLMVLEYAIQDLLVRGHERVLDRFGIASGATVVDYGCGPGRYLAKASRLVGTNGTVYAPDINPIALEYAAARVARLGLANVSVAPIRDGRCAIPDACADLVYALDMFHAVGNPTAFLAEIHRFTKPDGTLILEDGHQPRASSRRKIAAAGGWRIEAETRAHLRCVRA